MVIYKLFKHELADMGIRYNRVSLFPTIMRLISKTKQTIVCLKFEAPWRDWMLSQSLVVFSKAIFRYDQELHKSISR